MDKKHINNDVQNDREKGIKSFLVKLMIFVSFFFVLYSVLLSINWVGKLFPGFTISKNGEVTSLMHPEWTGARAGLRACDRIQGYDGIRFKSVEELQSYLQDRQNTQPVIYEVEREGETFFIAVPLRTFTWDDWMVTFFADILVGAIYIAIATVLFFFNPSLKANFPLFVTAFFSGLMQILGVDYYTEQNFTLLLFLSFLLFSISATQVHFSLFREHLRFKPSEKFFYKMMVAAIILGSALWFALPETSRGQMFMAYAVMSSYLAAFLVAHINCTHIYFTSSNLKIRNSIRAYNLVFLFVVPSYLYYLCRDFFDILLPREFVFTQLIYVIFLPLTIIRYHVAEFEIHLNRKTLALMLSVFYLITTVLFLFIAPAIVRLYGGSESVMSVTLAIGVLSIVSLLIYSERTRLFDRFFFFSSYRFRDLLTMAAHEVFNRKQPQELMIALSELIGEVFRIEKRALFLCRDSDLDATLVCRTMNLPEDFPLVLRQDILNDLSGSAMQEILQNSGLTMAFPIQSGANDSLLGVVLLSDQNLGIPLAPDDIVNLELLLESTAIALVNLRQQQALQSLQERLRVENSLLKQAVTGHKSGERIIGEDGDLKDIFERMRRISDSDVSILLRGESGVGKEVISRVLHERSRRHDKPFIAINCTALTETLLESELFGHEKGSFTGANERKIGLFEAAHEGTLFLDEIGDISPSMQAKLLRVLQEREFKRVGGTQAVRVDVRVIAATNKNLEEAVRSGKMREDLYFRLNVFPIFIKPLRERQNDLEQLVMYFVSRFSRRMNKAVGMPDAVEWDKIRRYKWPGNVRELQNVIERSVALAEEGRPLKLIDIDPSVHEDEMDDLGNLVKVGSYHELMSTFQNYLVKRALKRTAGNKSQAAQMLGIHTTHLYKILKNQTDKSFSSNKGISRV